MGCRSFQIALPDGTVATGVSCAHGDRGVPCATPGCAGRMAAFCSFKLANGEVCLRAMCERCRHQGDLCGPHARASTPSTAPQRPQARGY